jgi:hypothetical protein
MLSWQAEFSKERDDPIIQTMGLARGTVRTREIPNAITTPRGTVRIYAKAAHS